MFPTSVQTPLTTSNLDLLRSTSRKIVVAGSSTVYGTGSNTPGPGGTGWAYQFQTAMIAKGWQVDVSGVPGFNAANQLATFFTDLLPRQPDIILLSLTIGNENIMAAASGAAKRSLYFDNFLGNIKQFSALCKRYKIKLIVTTSYPRNAYSLEDVSYVRNYSDWLESSNIPSLDFFNVTANKTNGNYLTPYALMVNGVPEGTHANQAGHDAYFNSIPLDIFEGILIENMAPIVITPGASAVFDPTVASTASPYTSPLAAVMQVAPISWTVGFFAAGDPAALRLAMFNIGSALRIRHLLGTDNFYRLTGVASGTSTDLISTVVCDATTIHHHCVTYSAPNSIATYYIDGAVVGTITSIALVAEPAMYFMGDNTSGYRTAGKFGGLSIHRVELEAGQVAQLAQGKTKFAGLDLFCPIDSPTNSTFYSERKNLALTRSYLEQRTDAGWSYGPFSRYFGNEYKVLIKRGNSSFSPTTPTTVFTIAHGLGVIPGWCGITPGNTLSSALFDATWDITNITVTFMTGLTGTLSLNWVAIN